MIQKEDKQRVISSRFVAGLSWEMLQEWRGEEQGMRKRVTEEWSFVKGKMWFFSSCGCDLE